MGVLGLDGISLDVANDFRTLEGSNCRKVWNTVGKKGKMSSVPVAPCSLPIVYK